MGRLPITQPELLAIIEAVTRDAPDDLRLQPTGMWMQHHDEFCRRLATRLTAALRETGFAWARLPKHGDELYRILVAAASDLPAAYKIGISSDDPAASETARHLLAEKIGDFLKRTRTSVIRRQLDR